MSVKVHNDVSQEEYKESLIQIEALIQTLAHKISNLDAVGVTDLFTDIESAKYISDGTILHLNQIRETLENYYSTLRSMKWTWDKVEIQLINRYSGVVTAWANYTTVNNDGDKRDIKALYTHVCVKTGGEWSILQSHKSTL